MVRVLIAFCALLLSVAGAWAISGNLPVNPKTYTSASGKYSLFIDPSDRDGLEPATYRLSTAKGVTWSRKLPFTFNQAIVTESGVVAGYAHTHGFNGLAGKNPGKGLGELVIVTIGPDGKVRDRDTLKRQMSTFIDGGAQPTAFDILLHEQAGQFTVLLDDDTWRVYALSTGKLQTHFNLTTAAGVPADSTIWAAKPLPGTPLTLLNWFLRDEATGQGGALFVLIDTSGHPVWSLSRPGDYAALGEFPWEKLNDDRSLLKTSEPHRFDLWFHTEAQRVTFSVEQDPQAEHGWRIAEVAREKYVQQEPPAAAPAIEERSLELLGRFTLQDGYVSQPIRDIVSFDFDAHGRIAFLRRDGRAASTFVLIEPDGQVVAEIALPEAAQSERVAKRPFAPAGDGQWILTASEFADGEKFWAWRLDIETRTWTALPGFLGPPADALAALAGGGFVVLGEQSVHRRFSPEMRAYDRDGRPLWRVDAHTTPGEDSFDYPDALTATSTGELAVIDVFGARLRFFDQAGKHLRTFDTEKVLGRKLGRSSELSPGKDGGVLVFESSASPPLLRFSSEGAALGPWDLSAPNGMPARSIGRPKLAPNGQWWAPGADGFLRLDEEGRVVQSVGAPPVPALLGKIATVQADANGRLYVRDEQWDRVHVFAPDGRALHVCEPAAGDHKENGEWAEMQVTAGGAVYLHGEMHGKRGYLHFDPSGRRLGFEASDPARKSAAQRRAKQVAPSFVETRLGRIFLMDSAHRIQREIARHANGDWLDSPDYAAVAADGAFAVLDHQAQSAVSLYRPDGAPLRTIALPDLNPAPYGYNGTHLVLRSHDNEVVLYTAAGLPVQRFTAPHDTARLAKGGRELWLIEYEKRRVSRYAMP